MDPFNVKFKVKTMTTKFFDVYSSPIVRTFFRGQLETSCKIEWKHDLSVVREVGRQATTKTIDAKNSHREYLAEINGHQVRFNFVGYIGQKCDVDFTVDCTFDRKDLPRATKVAITRWLLAVWKLECANYSKFVGVPSGNKDEKGKQWRGDYYKKFGFQFVDKHRMVLENK